MINIDIRTCLEIFLCKRNILAGGVKINDYNNLE